MKSSNSDSDVAFLDARVRGHDTGPGCFIQGDRPEARCGTRNDEWSPRLLGVASNSRGPRANGAPFAGGCKDLAAPVPQGTAPIPGRP